MTFLCFWHSPANCSPQGILETAQGLRISSKAPTRRPSERWDMSYCRPLIRWNRHRCLRRGKSPLFHQGTRYLFFHSKAGTQSPYGESIANTTEQGKLGYLLSSEKSLAGTALSELGVSGSGCESTSFSVCLKPWQMPRAGDRRAEGQQESRWEGSSKDGGAWGGNALSQGGRLAALGASDCREDCPNGLRRVRLHPAYHAGRKGAGDSGTLAHSPCVAARGCPLGIPVLVPCGLLHLRNSHLRKVIRSDSVGVESRHY